VIFEVTLGGLVRVVVGMNVMCVRDVGVMCSLLVRSRFMVSCCFLVMTGGVFEVFGGLRVMLGRLFGHGLSLQSSCVHRDPAEGLVNIEKTAFVECSRMPSASQCVLGPKIAAALCPTHANRGFLPRRG